MVRATRKKGRFTRFVALDRSYGLRPQRSLPRDGDVRQERSQVRCRAVDAPSFARIFTRHARSSLPARFFVGGNFKANGSVADAQKLIATLNAGTIAST